MPFEVHWSALGIQCEQTATASCTNVISCFAQVVGRLVVGFGVSLSAIAECIYISEIAPAVSTCTL